MAVGDYLHAAALPGLLGAVGQVAIAVFVLSVNARDVRHWALAALLTMNAAWDALIALWGAAALAGDTTAVIASIHAQVYFIIAANAALVWFLTVYPRRTQWSRSWLPWALLAWTLALCAAFAVDHSVVFRIEGLDPSTTTSGPFLWVQSTWFLILAVGAVRCVRAATPNDRTPRIVALAMLTYPLLASVSMWGGFGDRMAQLAEAEGWTWWFIFVRVALLYLGGAMAPVVAVYAAWRGRMQDRWPAIVAGVAVPLTAAGIVSSGLTSAPAWAVATVDGLAAFAFASTIGYAVLRRRLFDIDVRMVVAVQRATFVAAMALSFLVLTQILQELVPTGPGTIVAITAAFIVALVVRPVHFVSDAVARQVTAGVDTSPATLAARKETIYKEAVRSAWADGGPGLRQRHHLESLRTQMQLGMDEALHLEAQALGTRFIRR